MYTTKLKDSSMKITRANITSIMMLGVALGCGRFDGHKHHADSNANPTGPSQQCPDLPHSGTSWKDGIVTAKTVADLRSKKCDPQADLLETKEQTFSKQVDLKSQFVSLSDADTCLGKNKALTDFYPGALSSLQSDFDNCLDNAGKAVDAGTCLATFKSGGTRYLNLADKMAGCLTN